MAPQGMNPKSRPSSRAPPGTPPDSPDLSPSTSFTLTDAQQLVDLVKAITAMHTIPAPSNSPVFQTSSPPVTWEDLKQLLLEVLQAKSEPPEAVKLEAQEDEAKKIQALKLEFKTVNEVYVSNNAWARTSWQLPLHSWDKKVHQYKVVESLKPKDAIGELDHYVFVVRARIGKYRLMFP